MGRRIVGIVVLLTLVLTGALVFSKFRHAPEQVSGFLESDDIRVGSRVGGRVAKVNVDEGQHVKANDVLVELEPYNLLQQRDALASELASAEADFQRLNSGYRKEEIAQAQAKRDQLAADLDRLKNGARPQEIAAAEARLDNAKASLNLAKITLDRIKPNYAAGTASAEEFDRASQEFQAAQAQMDIRVHELDLMKAGNRAEDIARGHAALEEAQANLAMMQAGYRVEDIAKAKASVDAAKAQLDAINQQIAELNVKAPLDAVVQAIDLRPGDVIAPNAPVCSLIDPTKLWVRAYVPEGRLDVKLNQPVKVKVDAFPNRTFAAVITFVSQQAEFTPNNVQTPEERSQQVFRIKATLTEGLDVLHPGVPADVLLK